MFCLDRKMSAFGQRHEEMSWFSNVGGSAASDRFERPSTVRQPLSGTWLEHVLIQHEKPNSY